VSKALRSGKCDAVFMWWEIFMDPDKKVLLSCAPKWAHPDPKEMVTILVF
jgi:protein arginine N-methyltransferase 7